MKMNNFFKRSEIVNNNFIDIYNKIKLLKKQEISKEIDTLKYSPSLRQHFHFLSCITRPTLV